MTANNPGGTGIVRALLREDRDADEDASMTTVGSAILSDRLPVVDLVGIGTPDRDAAIAREPDSAFGGTGRA